MTFRKYLRLCAVSFAPLLLIGFVLFRFFIPYQGQSNVVTCEEWSVDYENCRNVGDRESSFLKYVESQHPIWVDVKVSDWNPNLENYILVMATGRSFKQSRIVSAEPYRPASPEVRNYMQALVGKTATVVLGFDDNDKSVVAERSALLNCHSLEIKGPTGFFSAACFGQSWGGTLTFEVFGRERDRLETLKSAIQEEVSEIKSQYFMYRVVTYPLFVYLFLIASALIWLVNKAVRFVQRG